MQWNNISRKNAYNIILHFLYRWMFENGKWITVGKWCIWEQQTVFSLCFKWHPTVLFLARNTIYELISEPLVHLCNKIPTSNIITCPSCGSSLNTYSKKYPIFTTYLFSCSECPRDMATHTLSHLECPCGGSVVDRVAPGQACLYKYFCFPLSVSLYHYFIFILHLSTADTI